MYEQFSGHETCFVSFSEFHKQCIKAWIKTKKRSCPVCRSSFENARVWNTQHWPRNRWQYNRLRQIMYHVIPHTISVDKLSHNLHFLSKGRNFLEQKKNKYYELLDHFWHIWKLRNCVSFQDIHVCFKITLSILHFSFVNTYYLVPYNIVYQSCYIEYKENLDKYMDVKLGPGDTNLYRVLIWH